MEINNMGDHTIVCPEMFKGTPGEGSSTTQNPHIAIPIEELKEAIEIAKDNQNLTDSKDNVKKPEEKGECRYCQEEEPVFKLETPCGCTGSLKYAHRRCISQWCNRKGNTICEICKQPYYPNYAVTVPRFYYHDHGDDEIDMRERWTIPGTNTGIMTPLQLVQVGTNRLLRSMNVDFSLRHPTIGVIFGTALLVFLSVMVIKDAYNYPPPSSDDNFSFILYGGVVVLVAPIYILTWIMECRAERERERESERESERETERETEMERERDLTA